MILPRSENEVILWDVAALLEGFDLWTPNNRYVPDFTCEQREFYWL